PKPLVQGTQTAVVVGPKGEELYTDKYGRVKVQFHWDREGKNDEKSSCWVRVAQPIAGRRWGGSFWPRIGQEVVVDHLEGDPDQPIIIGTVYNADQMPPYLGQGPDSKHKDDNLISGLKSNTSKGGSGFNEFRFYDLKDKQQIFIHAERDYDLRVKNDTKERIYGNHHHVVGWEKDGKDGGDLRERFYQDRHTHVHRNRIEHVEGNIQQLVGKGKAPNGGNQEIVLEKSRHEKIGENCHITIGNSRHEKVGTVLATQAGQEIHLKAGQKVVIESDLQLMIKGAGGFVLIDPSGVTIQGTMVKINCGGSPIQGTSPSPTAPQEAKPTDPEIAVDAVTGQKSS
ncbi:MAG TPA: type VI secretion system tip protein TssI/VgrG, partial [Isosphaeraceae bacterium]|nr:type VI secretion system tip protein TssI/VgrG [Isosphaeraceae bacterium]